MLALSLILVLAVCEVGSSKFSYGREADKLCVAYKKICPRGKVCAIQTIQWPRPMKFPVCVHEYAVQVRSRVCTEAPSPGGCAAQFRRWYYNVHMAACSWFTYGGCGGNGNNFRSKEECEKVCIEGREDNEDEGGATTAGNHRGDDTTSFDDSQDDRGGLSNGRDDDTDGTRDDRGNGRHRDRNDRNGGADGQRGDGGYRYVGGDDHTYPYFPAPAKDNDAQDYYAATDGSQRANPAAEASASAAGLPRRLPSASVYTDRGSLIFDEADLSRRERKNPPVAYSNGERRHSSAAERLSEIAVQAPSIHAVNIHRKVSNGKNHFSHQNAPGALPLQVPRVLNLLQAPSRASDLTSVASGLNSALEGRYAAEGSETVRRFPKRKRKGRKGKKKSRRRGRKGRKGGKGRKQRITHSQKHIPHEDTTSQLTNDVGVLHSLSAMHDNTSSTADNNAGHHNQWNDASRRVAEFRQSQTGYWPEKIQSDEADQNAVSQSTTTTEQQPDDRNDRRGRGRKGKKRQRGERRSSKGRNGETEGYYPEKISLFGLLETPGSNETETPT